MTCEIVAIVVSKVTVLAFRSHIFVFNFGYQRKNLVSVEEVFAQLFLELIIEFTIDFIALGKEMRESDIPVDAFFGLLTKESASMIFYTTTLSVIWVIFACLSIPPSHNFCTDANDPCSCRSHTN